MAFEIIGDYQGYVQTDGYDGYARPCAQPGIVHVGCWAHVRRAFKEAADALGKVSSRAGSALVALGFIAKLYRAESELSKYRDEDPERFVAARRARVQPVLAKFHAWLQDKRDQVLPGTALGKAVAFALSEWPKLIRYLDHPQLRPDNNACEQAIRPFVVGRKNWLFSGSPRGAEASAILYSLIETAKATGASRTGICVNCSRSCRTRARAPTTSRSCRPHVLRRRPHRGWFRRSLTERGSCYLHPWRCFQNVHADLPSSASR